MQQKVTSDLNSSSNSIVFTDEEADNAAAFWTQERIAAAKPMELPVVSDAFFDALFGGQSSYDPKVSAQLQLEGLQDSAQPSFWTAERIAAAEPMELPVVSDAFFDALSGGQSSYDPKVSAQLQLEGLQDSARPSFWTAERIAAAEPMELPEVECGAFGSTINCYSSAQLQLESLLEVVLPSA